MSKKTVRCRSKTIKNGQKQGKTIKNAQADVKFGLFGVF